MSEREKKIVEDQKASARAALSGRPVVGAITARPDFVSEIEWQVLQSVSRNQPNGSGKGLTDLVNKLLFFKKRDAFLSAGEHTARRRELARQLLDMIPAQVKMNAIDPVKANEMETELIAELKRTL